MGNPTVTPIIELRHAWGYLVGDINDGQFSRGQITLAQGFGILTAGLVLGKQLISTEVEAAVATNIGNPTFASFSMNTADLAGAYTVEMADATHFVVSNPAGVEIGHGVLGTAFNAGGIGFTGTAGGTPCAPGDSFTVTLGAGSGNYAPYDPTKTDGTQYACAILGSGYKDTTTVAQKAGATVRGPVKVNASELIYGPNVTTAPQQTSALAMLTALGILSV